MVRLVVGSMAASVAMFMYGFMYWGVNTLPYATWKTVPDHEAAGQALLENFPESGMYFLPAMGLDADSRTKMYESGPVGFVTIDRDGRPEFDSSVMAQGFILNLVSAVLLAVVIWWAASGLPSYGSRVVLAALVGLVATVFIDFGDAVWWYDPWDWKCHEAFYDFSSFVVAGLVLAAFVKPAASSASE